MRTKILSLFAIAVVIAMSGRTPSFAQDQLGQPAVKQTAEEAFVYGFPMVMNYAVFYQYFIDKSDPSYKAPLNQI